MYALPEAFGGLSEKNPAARKAPGVFSLTPRRGRLAEANLTLYTVVRFIERRNV